MAMGTPSEHRSAIWVGSYGACGVFIVEETTVHNRGRTQRIDRYLTSISSTSPSSSTYIRILVRFVAIGSARALSPYEAIATRALIPHRLIRVPQTATIGWGRRYQDATLRPYSLSMRN